MGQEIKVNSVEMGELALFDTDRSITGQDGLVFESVATDSEAANAAAQLAKELFAGDPGLDNIHVLLNQVTVRRPSGWDEESLHQATEIIRNFFVFYKDDPGTAAEDGE